MKTLQVANHRKQTPPPRLPGQRIHSSWVDKKFEHSVLLLPSRGLGGEPGKASSPWLGSKLFLSSSLHLYLLIQPSLITHKSIIATSELFFLKSIIKVPATVAVLKYQWDPTSPLPKTLQRFLLFPKVKTKILAVTYRAAPCQCHHLSGTCWTAVSQVPAV